MRASVTIFASIAAIVALAACQEQKTIVVEQASAGSVAAAGVPAAAPPHRPAAVHTPCDAPAGTGPFEHFGKPSQSQPVRWPERAISENVAGCAGARFRIGPDGAAQDVTVMAEYPAGYGFGDTIRQALETTRWPGRDDLAWHYLVIIRKASPSQG
jgi:hypothetical protein